MSTKKFVVNIADDLEYLMDSNSFIENRIYYLTLEDGDSELFSDRDSRTNKRKLICQ